MFLDPGLQIHLLIHYLKFSFLELHLKSWLQSSKKCQNYTKSSKLIYFPPIAITRTPFKSLKNFQNSKISAQNPKPSQHPCLIPILTPSTSSPKPGPCLNPKPQTPNPKLTDSPNLFTLQTYKPFKLTKLTKPSNTQTLKFIPKLISSNHICNQIQKTNKMVEQASVSELSHILLSSEHTQEIATSDQGLATEEARIRFSRDG